MLNPVENARSILHENRLWLSVRVMGASVRFTPIVYLIDTKFNFIDIERLTLGIPNVAVSIINLIEPSNIADGIQLRGTAHKEARTDLSRVMDLYLKQSFPAPLACCGSGGFTAIQVC